MEMTDWRDVVHFEDLYQVALPDRVRSLDRYIPQGSRWGHPVIKLHRGRELTPYVCQNGRQRVVCMPMVAAIAATSTTWCARRSVSRRHRDRPRRHARRRLGWHPRLSGNLCRGEGELFDDFEDPEVVEYCLPTPLQALPRAF